MVKAKQSFTYLADGSVDIADWLEKVKNNHQLKEASILGKACELAKKLGQGLTTFYGQSCIEQGLDTADIILDLKLDQETAAAAIASSIIAFGHLNEEIIKKELGDTVCKLVLGTQKIELIATQKKNKTDNTLHLDKTRKMLLAMATDIRIVIIKLAERLCLMRGIKSIPAEQRKRYAQEMIDIYAPLANRLGIAQLKWELEDLSLRYLEPATYTNIASFLSERRVNREGRIHDIVNTLKNKLDEAHIKANISGRAKHIYSIYAKAKRNHLNYQDIYDYSAIRLLVNTVEECYAALGIVHSLWSPITKEFDDYIANPKPNGYRSIHTALIDKDGKHFEIQIRTYAMHEEAERGVAAHWVYKENTGRPLDDLSKIAYLRQLLDWHKDIAKPEGAKETTQPTVPEDVIYVLTPQGDILDMPMGATPLDFAYHVHSEVGHRCRGAKVNGRIAHLNSSLRTGDKVEILTVPEGGPSRDWLSPEHGYLKTSRARQKVSHWFKQQLLNQEIAAGKRAKTIEKPIPHVSLPSPPKPIQRIPSTEIAGASYLLTRLAKCCKPIPGDAIIGYIAQGRGLSIHKKSCNNISHLSNTKRFMEIDWDNKNIGVFNTDVRIIAHDHEKIVSEVTSLLANEKINLLGLNSSFNNNQSKVTILVTLQIKDLPQLKNLMHKIEKLPGVLDVTRIKK